jgi:hypothetical protein
MIKSKLLEEEKVPNSTQICVFMTEEANITFKQYDRMASTSRKLNISKTKIRNDN